MTMSGHREVILPVEQPPATTGTVAIRRPGKFDASTSRMSIALPNGSERGHPPGNVAMADGCREEGNIRSL
jgi:hypothetical protein